MSTLSKWPAEVLVDEIAQTEWVSQDSAYELRRQLCRNLREHASRGGAIQRLPEALADMLLFT